MKLFSLLSVSALWIALMGIFWIASLCQISSLPYDLVAAIILFLVTFADYAADHAGGSHEDLLNNPNRTMLAKYPIKLLAVAAYVAAIIITFLWDASKLFAVAVPGIAGALYTARIGNTPLFNSDNVYQFSPKMNN